jgi:hypothetical protein
VGDETYRTLD